MRSRYSRHDRDGRVLTGLLKASFWRDRRTTVVAMVALLMALICFGVQSLNDLNRWHEQQLRTLRVGTWFTLQAQAHFSRLMIDLDRYTDGDPAITHDALMLQFEVFWSRIDVFGFEEAAVAFLGEAGVENFVHSSITVLQRAEPQLRTLKPGDTAAAKTIKHELNKVGADLGALSLTINSKRVNSLRTNDIRSAELFRRVSIGMAATAAAGFVLVLMLLSAMRQQRRHLQTALAAERQVSTAKADLQAVIDSLPAIISARDRAGRYLFVNRSFAQFFGVSQTATIGSTYPPQGVLAPPTAADILPEQQGGYHELEVAARDGKKRTMLTTDVPIEGEGQSSDRTVRIALDITERKEAENRIRFLAECDVLTGVPNRAFLLDHLDRLLRQRPLPLLSLTIVDLDDFKAVNEMLGHPAGDALLVALALRLGESEGDSMICRLGGDEFAVLTQGVRSDRAAMAQAEALQARLQQPFMINDNIVHVSVSLGLALTNSDASTTADLLRHAEIALANAKSKGRGRIASFTASLAAQHMHRKRLETDLHAALANGAELRLEYQPKFELPTRHLTGFEALLRWDHPQLGPISPSVFVPIAEEIGLIGRLGSWVIAETARQIAEWERQGLGAWLKFAVNLSAAQFIHGDIVSSTITILNAAGVRPDRLSIEITESILMRDVVRATEALKRFREHGIGVAIDDFGTGFSSLSYLVQFPFDELKIDRNFVRTMLHSPAARAVVRSVIDLARSLEATVVAEGIENERQLAALRDMGCRLGQGFFLSEPLRPAEAALLMENCRALAAAS